MGNEDNLFMISNGKIRIEDVDEEDNKGIRSEKKCKNRNDGRN